MQTSKDTDLLIKLLFTNNLEADPIPTILLLLNNWKFKPETETALPLLSQEMSWAYLTSTVNLKIPKHQWHWHGGKRWELQNRYLFHQAPNRFWFRVLSESTDSKISSSTIWQKLRGRVPSTVWKGMCAYREICKEQASLGKYAWIYCQPVLHHHLQNPL